MENPRPPHPSQPLTAAELTSPLGPIIAAVDAVGALVYLDFVTKTGPTPAPGPSDWRGHRVLWSAPAEHRPLATAADQLASYFAGTRQTFELPLAPIGNAFQHGVWDQLLRITYGTTISYGELARRLNLAGGARAVGRANGHNPIAIVIPCHRVIGADGTLTGYSGGIERKAALLALERAQTPAGQAMLPLGPARGRAARPARR